MRTIGELDYRLRMPHIYDRAVVLIWVDSHGVEVIRIRPEREAE
jgi:hypothetical protein